MTLYNNIAMYLFKNIVQIYRVSFPIAQLLVASSLGINIPFKDHYNTLGLDK